VTHSTEGPIDPGAWETYEGNRYPTGCVVFRRLGNICTLLIPRNDLRNHSPVGFNWGYGGSGPAQLALALLADVATDEVALRHYQRFKRQVISTLVGDTWTLTAEQIVGWLEAAMRLEAAPEPEGGDS
jgi:hypothetical protein